MTNSKWLRITVTGILLMITGSSVGNAEPGRGLQISIGPLVTPANTGSRLTGSASAQAGMLHRFKVEIVDAAGTVIPVTAAWSVEIGLAAVGCERSCVRLTAGMTDLSLPRPLGMHVAAGEAITAVAHVENVGTDQPVFLRVTIEYDAAELASTRLGIVPVTARNGVATAASQATWEWRATTSGRLLALAGAAISDARDLILEDVTTGAVMWRASNRGTRLAFAPSNPYVRLGAALVQGHTYRLTAVYASDAAAAPTSVIALALPFERVTGD